MCECASREGIGLSGLIVIGYDLNANCHRDVVADMVAKFVEVGGQQFCVDLRGPLNQLVQDAAILPRRENVIDAASREDRHPGHAGGWIVFTMLRRHGFELQSVGVVVHPEVLKVLVVPVGVEISHDQDVLLPMQ